MPREKNDIKTIKELIQIMTDNDLVEVNIEHGDDKICLKRANPQPVQMTGIPMMGVDPGGLIRNTAESVDGATGGTTPEDDNLIDITSPMVGTFYEAPSPDSPPYMQIGTQVSPQSVCGIIEAMKVMNEIKAEVTGTVAQICVSNGQAIEYGQVLFKVTPS